MIKFPFVFTWISLATFIYNSSEISIVSKRELLVITNEVMDTLVRKF